MLWLKVDLVPSIVLVMNAVAGRSLRASINFTRAQQQQRTSIASFISIYRAAYLYTDRPYTAEAESVPIEDSTTAHHDNGPNDG